MTTADDERMFNFTRRDYEPALDADDNRDLVALFNEARDPQDIARVATMARLRTRARRNESTDSGRTRRERGARLTFGRVLSFRH